MIESKSPVQAGKNAGSASSNKPSILRRGSKLSKSASVFVAAALASSLCIVPMTGAYASDDSVEAQAETAPTFNGYNIVEKCIKDDKYIPTLEELKLIDFPALRLWNSDLAKKLETLKKSLEEAQSNVTPPSAGEEGNLENNSGNSSGSNNSSESANPVNPANPVDPEDNTSDANPIDPDDANLGDADSEELTDEGFQPDVVPSTPPTEENSIDAAQYPQWSYSGDKTLTITHYTDNMNAQKLVAVIGEQAREVAQEYGVSASEMIGLAIAESFSGTSYMAQAPIRNLFGHTTYEAIEIIDYDEFGVACSDPYTQYVFSEDICKYDTYKACLEDHAFRVANGIEEAIPDDGTWGGAEGSLTYRVMSAIEDYDLTRYDEPLDYETKQPLTIQVWDEETASYVSEEVTLSDLVAEITSHLGVPYVWGGTTPSGFDCSGLVQYSYANALQMNIPRTTMYQCLKGADVDFKDLHMGDMLFFTSKDGVCCHVGMYLGEGCYVEAPHKGAEVQVTMMDEKRPMFAKRLIPTVPTPTQPAESQVVAS